MAALGVNNLSINIYGVTYLRNYIKIKKAKSILLGNGYIFISNTSITCFLAHFSEESGCCCYK